MPPLEHVLVMGNERLIRVLLAFGQGNGVGARVVLIPLDLSLDTRLNSCRGNISIRCFGVL
ncbi:hypothetical protein D3C86_1839190 [compost metagenome]